MQTNIPKDIGKKIIDTPQGPKCTCDVCGKEHSRVGSFSYNTKTSEPMVICYDCTIKISAEREGVSKKEYEQIRKRALISYRLFAEQKIEEYCKTEEKQISEKEMNYLLERINKVWNSLTEAQKKSFEGKTDKELRLEYKNIKVYF